MSGALEFWITAMISIRINACQRINYQFEIDLDTISQSHIFY